MDILLGIKDFILEKALWLCGLFALFVLLEKAYACNPQQKTLRPDLLTDILYNVTAPFFGRCASVLFMSALLFWGWPFEGAKADDYWQVLQAGQGFLAHLPFWLQIILYLIISDFMLYWIHRLFHQRGWWEFHAVHHSPQQLDWLSYSRFHFVNRGLAFVLVDLLCMLMGIPAAVIIFLAPFNIVYSAFVHANIAWDFGRVGKYILASPVFHRWHHTAQEEGMDKNFAPTFPLLDVMFGTFYMPAHLPQTYGVPDKNMPTDFWHQQIYPFMRLVKKK